MIFGEEKGQISTDDVMDVVRLKTIGRIPSDFPQRTEKQAILKSATIMNDQKVPMMRYPLKPSVA